MGKREDGGPAYPVISDGVNYSTEPGMSLRDYFAAQAMTGILASGNWRTREYGDSASGRYVVPALAYEYADAMLKAREAQP